MVDRFDQELGQQGLLYDSRLKKQAEGFVLGGYIQNRLRYKVSLKVRFKSFKKYRVFCMLLAKVLDF